jgi:hypothetical protein
MDLYMDACSFPFGAHGFDSHKYETSSNDMTYDATWLVKDDHVLLALILCFHLGLSNRHILQWLMQLLH